MPNGFLDPPVGERRPLLLRGDWVRALTSGRMRVRAWEHPPSVGEPARVEHRVVPWGAYLGPVHAVDHTDRFVAVEVPHPDDDRAGLVWFNVWTSRNHREEFRGVAFCRPVPPEVLLAWQRRGWVNRFLWRQEESEESEESLA